MRFIGHQKILCEIINETTLTSLNTQSNSESNTHSNHTNKWQRLEELDRIVEKFN